MIRLKDILTEATNANTMYELILNQTGYSDYYESKDVDVAIPANRSSFGPIQKFVTKLMYGKKRANKAAGDPAAIAALILRQLKSIHDIWKDSPDQAKKIVTGYYNQLNNEFITNWHGFKLPDYLDNVYEGKPRARKAFKELGDWVNANTNDTWGLKYPYHDKWYQRLSHNMKKSSTPYTGIPSTNLNMLDTSGSE